MLLNAGYLPVIAPVAVSEKGEALNVDADRAAAMVASALKAETLLLLTAVPGLMKNFPDESTLIRQLPQSQLAAASEAAQGRMKKKVLGRGGSAQGRRESRHHRGRSHSKSNIKCFIRRRNGDPMHRFSERTGNFRN